MSRDYLYSNIEKLRRGGDNINEMSILGERLRRMRELRGFTREELAAKAGISASTIYNCEKAGSNLTSENLKKIAKILDVSVDYLLGLTDEPEETKQSFIDKLRNIKFIPVYNSAGAGSPKFPEQAETTSWLGIPAKDLGEFGVVVHGYSMEPIIHDGDIVIVAPNVPWKNGDTVLIFDYELNGAVVKKIFEKDGFIILQSLNLSYSPIVVPLDSAEGRIKIIGKVVNIYNKGSLK